MAKETFWEALANPDIMKGIASLQSALSKLTGTVGDLTIPGSGGSSGGATLARVSLPIQYENMLELLATAKIPGVIPFYDRSTVVVKAGTTNYLIGDIPADSTGTLVYMHNMWTSINSDQFLMTHQTDNLPPLVVQAPMNKEVSLLGAFMGTVNTRITHTLENNDSVDITFTEEVQALIMPDNFAKQVFFPLINAQSDLLQTMAQGIVTAGGAHA